MISLLLKDFLVQKKTFLFVLLYIVFAIVAMGSAAFIAAGTAAAYILLLTALAYDDKNKSDVVLNSIPVARNSIVKARYLSVFIFAGFGIIAYWLISLISKVLHLPLNFKYGYIKARVFHFILFLAVFLIPTFLAEYLQDLEKYLMGRPDWVIILYILGLILIIVGFSYGISLRIYRNKEF